jgi:hypothetical protein
MSNFIELQGRHVNLDHVAVVERTDSGMQLRLVTGEVVDIGPDDAERVLAVLNGRRRLPMVTKGQ